MNISEIAALLKDAQLAAKVRELCAKAGLTVDLDFVPCRGGRNNRSFIIRSASNELFLKVYFRSAGDLRNRCRAEFSFLKFAAASGVTCVPKPLLCAEEVQIALYERVNGESFSAADITDTSVAELVEFVRALNEERFGAEGVALGDASEACFSLKAHIERVTARVGQLEIIPKGTALDDKASEIVAQQLNPAWQGILRQIESRAEELGMDTGLELTQKLRVISPSDFGFHNALRAERGTVFIDFEYAGWDDPAKTICDLFLQPDMPLPKRYWQEVARCFTSFGGPGCVERAELLMPLIQLKWCCIMLNEFLPREQARREFSLGEDEVCARKLAQLSRVAAILAEIERNLDRPHL